MNNRSYFTTPAFVSVALLALLVTHASFATSQTIQETTDSTYLQTTDTYLNTLRYLHSQKNTYPNHIETPEIVRAIYMSSWVAGTSSLRNNLIQFIDDSNINAVVIDIKDSTGVISFPINHPTIEKYGTIENRISDIDELIKKLHERDIYIIGRLTAFQDPALSKKFPRLSFNNSSTNTIWTDRKGLSFINPQEQEAWEYLVQIAKESYKIGFDEINFDYIRYPSDGNISAIDYELTGNMSRQSVMKTFYQYLDIELRTEKIPISADIFGLVTTAQDDIGIGQIFEDIYQYFDYIAPMVYPSHYSSGFFGYANPNAEPYGVVKAAMSQAIVRAKALDQNPNKLRTWIQDFSIGSPAYGKTEVTAQIKAINDLGIPSYMSWDPKNRYTQEAYK